MINNILLAVDFSDKSKDEEHKLKLEANHYEPILSPEQLKTYQSNMEQLYNKE